MEQSKPKGAKRIGAQDLAQAARLGVERALAARQALTELTPEQTQQVSGAAATLGVARPPIMGVVVRPPIMGLVILKPPVVIGLVATKPIEIA